MCWRRIRKFDENRQTENKQTNRQTENSKPEATLIPVDRRGERANKKHPNQGSEGDIRCKYCPKQFNVFRMYRHVQAKHPNVPPETYENEPEHENNIHVDESRKFKCNFCPKTRKHNSQVHPG